MMALFGLGTGLSDRTLENATAITSVAMGARIIEKHFTLDRTSGGPGDSFSLEPTDLAALCQGAKTAWQAVRASGLWAKVQWAGECGVLSLTLLCETYEDWRCDNC